MAIDRGFLLDIYPEKLREWLVPRKFRRRFRRRSLHRNLTTSGTHNSAVNGTADPGAFTTLELDHAGHIVWEHKVVARGTALDVEVDEVGAGSNVCIGLRIVKEILKMSNYILLVFVFLAGPPSLYRCICSHLFQNALDDLALCHFNLTFPSSIAPLGVFSWCGESLPATHPRSLQREIFCAAILQAA